MLLYSMIIKCITQRKILLLIFLIIANYLWFVNSKVYRLVPKFQWLVCRHDLFLSILYLDAHPVTLLSVRSLVMSPPTFYLISLCFYNQNDVNIFRKCPGEGIMYLSIFKVTAPHSRTLAGKIPWMEEPGGLQSMGSLRVGHD